MTTWGTSWYTSATGTSSATRSVAELSRPLDQRSTPTSELTASAAAAGASATDPVLIGVVTLTLRHAGVGSRRRRRGCGSERSASARFAQASFWFTCTTSTAVTLYSGQLVAQSEFSVVTTLALVSGKWKVV